MSNIIDAREKEKKEIEKQLAIEKQKNRTFSYPQILAYLDYIKTIGGKNPAQRSILINTFVHSVYLYDDHLTIIFNGGKGQISAENIPFKKIEKSLKSDKFGTNLCSAVVTSVPPKRMTTRYGWSFFLVSGESKISMQPGVFCKGRFNFHLVYADDNLCLL